MLPAPDISIMVQGDLMTVFEGSVSQWYFNGAIIEDETSQVLTANQSGVYSVLVTDSNGCASLSSQVIIQTGIDAIDENKLNVYPNPLLSGDWHINVDEILLGSEYEIYDVNGRIVYNSFIENVNTEISFNPSAGTYYMKIAGKNSGYMIRLIKI